MWILYKINCDSRLFEIHRFLIYQGKSDDIIIIDNRCFLILGHSTLEWGKFPQEDHRIEIGIKIKVDFLEELTNFFEKAL